MSKSIPQLSAVTSAQAGDLLHLVSSNVDKKIDFSALKSSIMALSYKTIFVDSYYGSDVTGAVEDPAKPFATIAAALTAGQAYFVSGLAPSASEPVLVKINGTFSEDLELIDYYNYDLGASVISGMVYDNGVDVNCIVYGKATIGTTGQNPCIELTASNSNVSLTATHLWGESLIDNTCTLRVYDAQFAQTTGFQLQIYGGTIYLYNCYMVNTSTSGSRYSNIQIESAGYLDMHDCILYSSKSCIETVNASSTTGYISSNGCYMKTIGTNFDCINLTTSSGSNITLILKDTTLIANGTGNSIDASQATNVKIYGRCQTNLTHDAGNVTLQVGTVANGGFIIDTNVI